MKSINKIQYLALALFAAFSCSKNDQFLPPEWNYEIPRTDLKGNSQIGAFYNIYTTADWSSPNGYTPELSRILDEDGELVDVIPYTATQDGVLTKQLEMAEIAGIDFFIIPWNNGASESNFISAYEFYRTHETKVKLVVNYSFGHLKINGLEATGEDFEKVADDFKALYTTLFSKDWYYHMPDGRPILIVSGMANETYDWSSFLPAFRAAMKEYTEELRAGNPDMAPNILDFYIVGENTTNWANPVTNAETAKHLDANYVLKWFPSTYYERWYCFYPFTDMAWQNWRKYASEWGNDFIPCIYPEFEYTDKKARYIERSEQNYITFCNVAKRNVGSQNLIFINSWNDFRYDSALEPAIEYGDTYMNITRRELSNP